MKLGVSVRCAREVDHQLEGVVLRAQGLERSAIDLAVGSRHCLAAEALGGQGQGHPPVDVVEVLEDPGLDRQQPQRALAALVAIELDGAREQALPLFAQLVERSDASIRY